MKDTFKFKRVIEKFLSFAYFCYFELLPKTFLLFWGYSHLTDVIFPYSEFLEEQEAKLSFYNTMTAEASSCLEASAYWWLFMPFCGSAKILQIFSSSLRIHLFTNYSTCHKSYIFGQHYQLSLFKVHIQSCVVYWQVLSYTRGEISGNFLGLMDGWNERKSFYDLHWCQQHINDITNSPTHLLYYCKI